MNYAAKGEESMKKQQTNKKNKKYIFALTGLLLAGLVFMPFSAYASEKTSENTIKITADIPASITSPTYTVNIPTAVSMGALQSVGDNVQEYTLSVKSKEKSGSVVISAPESGLLYQGNHSLAFTNDFGTQTIKLSNEASTDDAIQLGGRILILGKDVLKAVPGNYSGTTVFSIQYQQDTKKTDVPKKEDPHPNSGGIGENTLKKNTLGSNSFKSNSLNNGLSVSGLKNGLAVKTGDETSVLLWIAVLLISSVSIFLLIRRLKIASHTSK